MVLAAAATLSGPSAADGAVSPAGARQKVIFHVGDADPARWTAACNNIFDVRKEQGAETGGIEVVHRGAGHSGTLQRGR